MQIETLQSLYYTTQCIDTHKKRLVFSIAKYATLVYEDLKSSALATMVKTTS